MVYIVFLYYVIYRLFLFLKLININIYFFHIHELFVYQKLNCCDQTLPKTKNKSLLLILTKIYFDTY